MTIPAVRPSIGNECCASGGETVLFLHGLPTSACLWNRVIEPMRKHFACLAVDLPGLGTAPPLHDGFGRLDRLAEYLERLRIQHGIERWSIVGHDAGCAVGIEYAHRFPQRVRRLALVTPSIFPELRPFSLFEMLRRPLLGELVAPAVNLCFWHIVMRAALSGSAWPGERQAAIQEFRAPFRGISGAWRLMALLRWGSPRDVLGAMPARLAQLSAPTIIFHGTEDIAVPAEFAVRAASMIRGAQVVMLNAGHFLPWNAAPELARGLETFLNQAESVDATPVAALVN